STSKASNLANSILAPMEALDSSDSVPGEAAVRGLVARGERRVQRCDCGRNLRGTRVALRGECAARGNGRARYRSASRLLHNSRSKEGRRTGPRQRIRAVAEGTTPTAHPFEA